MNTLATYLRWSESCGVEPKLIIEQEVGPVEYTLTAINYPDKLDFEYKIEIKPNHGDYDSYEYYTQYIESLISEEPEKYSIPGYTPAVIKEINEAINMALLESPAHEFFEEGTVGYDAYITCRRSMKKNKNTQDFSM